MLIAGAGASASAYGGALTFDVDTLPSDTWWYLGSAFIYIMLLAGASVRTPSSLGGAFPFSVGSPPSDTWWDIGSAPYIYISIVYYTSQIVDIAVS